jgi:hypothetical protein
MFVNRVDRLARSVHQPVPFKNWNRAYQACPVNKSGRCLTGCMTGVALGHAAKGMPR